MKTKTIKFNKTNPVPYYFENEGFDWDENHLHKSVYATVQEYEQETMFMYAGYETKDKLLHIVKQIKARIKITKQEIFKIGELLCMAKKECQQEAISFKEWIGENFDFSYETANNFMNVFKQCLGTRNIALQVPTSILYKISSSSFPDTLRDYLFAKGNLEKMTNGELKKLIEKYKKGGIEAVEKDITELNRGNLIFRQSNYTFDMCENALRTLQGLKRQIENQGGTGGLINFDEQTTWQQPEASEVNSKLHNALNTSIQTLETALSESRYIINDYMQGIEEIM